MLIRAALIAVITLVVVLVAIPLYPATQEGQHPSLEEFTAHLDARVPSLMATYDIPGASIVLVDDGEVVWSGTYGHADRATEQSVTADTYFRAQSISKSVTAWGVMKLVDQGRIALDDPVGHHITRWRFPDPAAREVTVRQLLSHTAGMPIGALDLEYAPGGDVPSVEERLSSEVQLAGPAGERFSYSNVGFNLLELLIEEVTGRDFAQYMDDEILSPLGMQRSTFAWTNAVASDLATGYDLDGNPVAAYVYPDKASGGLFATVEDVAAFAAAGMTGRPPAQDHPVLSSESLNALYSPVVESAGIYGLVFDAYGLGYFLETTPNGQLAAWHGGQGHGWMTHYHAVPEAGDGIVILTNSQRTWPLIATVVTDWARWRDLPAVGMGRILTGLTVLWIVIGAVLFALLWQVWRLAEGLVSGRRRFAPFAANARLLRAIQTGVFALSAAVLLWYTAQDYMLISSVFPIGAGWLVWSLAGLGLVALLSALIPRTAGSHERPEAAQPQGEPRQVPIPMS